MNHTMVSDYMAHGYCFSWEKGLVWLHVTSDILTGLSYYAIAIAMAYFAFKRRDILFKDVFAFFATFIIACGTTHFLAAYTVYVPHYWLEGYVKALTALVSAIAAVLFIPRIPEAIELPSLAKTLQKVNELNAEQNLNKERQLILLKVFQYEAEDIKDLLDFALEQALEMTSSRFGYIYLYDEEKRRFTLNSWSKGVMPECSIQDAQLVYDLDKTGLWGEVVRQRRSIVVNDFAAENPLKRGYPEGHVMLQRFASVPLIDRGRIVAVVGMANKESDYDDANLFQLTLLMDAVWKITERRRVEEELKQKVAELERFTYTVSHDLKSPLITIKGFTGAVEKALADGNYGQMPNDLKRISNAADKMRDLLNDLLELSRIGRIMHTPEAVDMNLLLQGVAADLAGPLQAAGTELIVQPGLPMVQCDRLRIAELVQNLVENAIKYIGDQPEPRIRFGVRVDGEQRVFFVQDNGTGIDEKYHATIFGLFNQLDTKSDGTGIGLALAKRIVEIHGGRIWVESHGSGTGSTFCFTLPKK
ncbi:MAG TPA: GAF domain-containing protein [Desulfuromonadales bacterium]|nr:GAF domain-containing protein [Desulfuromonadales bacterium]